MFTSKILINITLVSGKQAFSMFKRDDVLKEFNLLIENFTVELKTWFDDTTFITKEFKLVSFCFLFCRKHFENR